MRKCETMFKLSVQSRTFNSKSSVSGKPPRPRPTCPAFKFAVGTIGGEGYSTYLPIHFISPIGSVYGAHLNSPILQCSAVQVNARINPPNWQTHQNAHWIAMTGEPVDHHILSGQSTRPDRSMMQHVIQYHDSRC